MFFFFHTSIQIDGYAVNLLVKSMHAITMSVSCLETNSRKGERLHYLTVIDRRMPTMPASLFGIVCGPKH